MKQSNEMNGNALAYAPRPTQGVVLTTIKRLVVAIQRRNARNKAYQELTALNDRMLRDIGVYRAQIPGLVADMFDTVESFPVSHATLKATIASACEETQRKAA